MRILEVSPDYPPWATGGAPETFRLLAESWNSSGHEVTVACSRPLRQSNEEPAPGAIRVVSFDLWNLAARLHEARYFAPMTRPSHRRFLEFVRATAGQYDLVVVQGLLETMPREFVRHQDPADRAHTLSLQYGVSSADGSRLLGATSRTIYRSYGRRLSRRTPRVVLFSDESEREWHQYFGKGTGASIRRLGLGVDTETLVRETAEVQEHPSRVDEWLSSRGVRSPFVVAVGRNDRAKGFDVAIDALRYLGTDRPSLNLVLAGERTPFTDQLVKQAKAEGLEPRVVILGRVSGWERIALLSRADAFLIPSRKEGYGLNAVLARLLSKPTVATRTGAHPEIFAGDGRSRLVPPSDPQGFAGAIRDVLNEGPSPLAVDPVQISRFDIREVAAALVEIGTRRP